MKYTIEKQGEEIVISFDNLGGDAQLVMDAIGRCRHSPVTCAAGECAKIDGMESCERQGAIALRLKPRDDVVLDVASIGECLKYHLPRHFEK